MNAVEPFRPAPTFNRSTAALAAWACVIIAAGVLPLSNFVGHGHWAFVQWTVRPEDWRSARFYADVLANTMLFYPFGLLMARHFTAGDWRDHAKMGGIGTALSLGVELYQVYCHNRHPSSVDLVSNTTGTILGSLTAARVYSIPAVNRWFPSPYSHPTGS